MVEIAECDIAGPAGNKSNPIVECLAVVAGKVFAAAFHFDQYDGLPDQVGKGSAPGIVVFHAHFERGAGFFDTAMPEGLEHAVEEDLGFALFVAGDVLSGTNRRIW